MIKDNKVRESEVQNAVLSGHGDNGMMRYGGTGIDKLYRHVVKNNSIRMNSIRCCIVVYRYNRTGNSC